MSELRGFYRDVLELPDADSGYAVGCSRLSFSAADGAPFYHYAMLVPGNRFTLAQQWAAERVELLPVDDSGETVAFFPFWDAHSIYFHDPVGNIIELIAHAGIRDSSRRGSFAAEELLQLSEIGLVGDTRALTDAVCSLGPEVADGDPDDPDHLVFIGPPTSSVIISPAGRGWLPLGRAAERHPVDLTLLGASSGEVIVGGHRIRQELPL